MGKAEFRELGTYLRGQCALPANLRTDTHWARMQYADACGPSYGPYREAIHNAAHWRGEARKHPAGKVRTEYAQMALGWLWIASQLRQAMAEG